MKKIDRRHFISTLGLGTSAALLPRRAATADAPASQRPPNIVFIMVDDMGYADLGCYGSKAIQTPRIDRMAAEGMRFTQAYSGCTVCAPARSTLMTGLHMGHTPVRGNTGGISLPGDVVTVADLLKEAGYATGGFGKWGLGDLDTPGVPEKQGFDVFYGYYHQIHAHDYYPEYLIRNGKKESLEGNQGKGEGTYAHQRIFEETLRFIEENKDRPFFCYAPWTPPHGKYVIPNDDPAWKAYATKKWSHKARVVAAMDNMIDRQVGQLLDRLAELGIDDNTIVFFCSDNGAAYAFDGELDSSGPLRGAKRSMCEGGIRVPMIARWPKHIPAATTSTLPCYFPDVLPTLAELAGANVPSAIDGISILPTLLAEAEQDTERTLYWEWPLYEWKDRAYPPGKLLQALRRGKWKMLRHGNEIPWELYDLDKDLGEEDDIAKKHPEVVAELETWITQNRIDPPPQIEPPKAEGLQFR